MTRIGKYEVRGEFGADPLTRTFRAFDPDAARPVTILVLAPLADPQHRAAFRNHAAAAAQIHHRSLAAIYELGEHAGQPFVAMQSREGEDLAQVIANRTSLTLLQKMSMMAEVAQALQTAHGAGILHVGLRPSGIVLLADGSVRLAEFGAVRSPGQAGALYVAPEELTCAAPADALSDIFAYGIVYYELLTGKHPFHSGDPDGMARRIVEEQPVPLRTWAPECPEPLEKIVHGALQKERELRYQSLDDVLWDAEPILQALRRERAVALLIEGRRLAGEGQLDQAQAIVREAMNLDPGYRPAQRLRDALRNQIQRALIRSRLEALLEQADREVAARRFVVAIQILESALRLDSTEAAVLYRLEKARALLESSLRASGLAGEAKRLAASGQLDEALRYTSEALEADPQCEEARRLREQMDAEQTRRDRAAAVQRALEEAQWLMEQDRPDLAAQLLRERSAAYPEAAEITERLSLAELAVRRWEKRRFVQEMVACVTALEQREQWRTAATVLQEALQSEPEAVELVEAAARVRTQLEAEERRKKLARRLEIIRQKIVEEAWTEALSLIEAAQMEFPREPELEPLLAQANAGRQRAECENAIRTIEQCLSDGELPQAAELLRHAIQGHPTESRLLALQEELEREKDFQARWQEAEMLFGRSHFAAAEKILVELAARKPHSREVQALLETVRSGRAAAEEVQFYNQGRVKALRLWDEQQWDQAADLLRNLQALFPNDAILERDLQSVMAARDRHQQETGGPAEKPLPTAPSEPPPAVETSLSAGVDLPGWSLPPPVPFWRRPAVLAFGVFLVAAPAALTLWRFSRKQHTVALASAGAVETPAAPPILIRDEGPVAAGSERLRGEGEFRNAELLSGPSVTLPPSAGDPRPYGAVNLQATISQEGTVTEVVVVSGHPVLAEAARQAILARRYRPATLNGKPVEVKMPIQVVLEPQR